MQAFKSPKGAIGAGLLLVLVSAALLAPMFFPGGYDQQSGNSLQPPSWANLFGTDELGRDLFTRTVFGLRTDLSIVAVAVPLGLVVGTTLGMLGAISRSAGTLVQRFLDVVVGFPGIVLGVSIVLVIGPGWISLVLAIAISSLPTFGRLSRATMLSQSQREYVTAARTLGVSRIRVVLRHILPNAMGIIIVAGTLLMSGAILIESALSFLGFGVRAPDVSLGLLISKYQDTFSVAPFLFWWPGLFIISIALFVNFIGDGLRDAFDPRQKKRISLKERFKSSTMKVKA